MEAWAEVHPVKKAETTAAAACTDREQPSSSLGRPEPTGTNKRCLTPRRHSPTHTDSSAAGPRVQALNDLSS